MITPNEVVIEVVDRVQRESGVPVLINPDASLSMLATVRMARGNAPAHLISYNPKSAQPEYSICYQCGFILRVFALSKEERFDVAGAYRGRKDVEKLIAEHLKRSGSLSFPKEAREKLRDQIYDGLMLQLRSIPTGLRNDAWLADTYPALAEQQRAMIGRQLTDNLLVLRPNVRSIAPEKVLAANSAMNAAFAMFWSRRWAEPQHTAAYKATGYIEAANELMRVFDELPPSPNNDKILISKWADVLGITGWFEFVPFQ